MSLEDNLKKSEENASAIEREIDYLEENSSNSDYRNFWNNSKKVVELFRTSKPLLRQDRERMWDKYSGLCKQVKQEMSSRKEEAKENASKIEQELGKLENDYCDTTLTLLHVNYRFREFWQKAREVTGLFKSTKNLLKEDRERLWDRYSTICDSAKSSQAERNNESAKNKDTITSLLNDAYFQAGGSSNLEELRKAKSLQSYILGLMKEKTLTKNDREPCWDFWKKVWGVIDSKQEKIGERNFLQAKDETRGAVNAAYYGDPYDALKEIKAVQGNIKGLYMTKSQRSEISGVLNDAWEKASSKISEKKAERTVIKEEKQRKYNDWHERMEGHIQRWENNIEKSKGYISSLEEQIDRLEGEADNARTDEYADMVRGWIEEKYQKITDVKGQIQDLEDKISSGKNKLG